MLAATSERAWVAAMLQFEAALAAAAASLGLIPREAVEAISARCGVDEYDIAQLGRDARRYANPAAPLVDALRSKVDKEAGQFVHLGATSQDVIDTAMMLIAQKALGLVLESLDRAAAGAARMADEHRSTLMVARTLMQQALPASFGLKAAGWLTSIDEVRASVEHVRYSRIALQFGGAAGTLASLGDRGLELRSRLAQTIGLPDTAVPWHTSRARVVEIGNALGVASGVAGKVALDILLMSQTEVGEVSEGAAEGKGGSSTLPQKRNSVQSVSILAAVRSVNAQVALLQSAMVQEQERAAGAWQAEWPALSEVFRLAAGAIDRMADLLLSLEVDTARMRRNLDASGGLVMAESVVAALSRKMDAVKARQLVQRLIKTSGSTGKTFDQLLKGDGEITSKLDSRALEAALDPENYLGASEQMIDRALEAYQATRKERND
jgi:3-carboxy-cis,cis-muconate cycloisomerase